MDARATYTEGREKRAREEAALDSRSRAIAALRLVIAAAIVALIGAIVWVPLPSNAWAGDAACVVLFAALVVVHARVHREKDRASAMLRFHQRGLDRLDGKWRDLPATGERFRSAEHPFTDDL